MRILQLWPQLTLLLFLVFLLQQQYNQYKKRITPLSKQRFASSIIGVVLMLIILYFGGFFNMVWQK